MSESMKIIISHDIDHYNWSDHFFKDLFIQKYILKNTFYLLSGQIPFSLFRARMNLFKSNRLHRLEELISFNREHCIPASYFMGVRNALGLSYNLTTAEKIATYLNEVDAPLYIHGIAFDDVKEMEFERDTFIKIVRHSSFLGMRMHYLRNSEMTLKILDSLNYKFDSTTYEIRNPYYVGKMIEFPVCAMEAYEVDYADTDLNDIKKSTLSRIENAKKKSLDYFTVIFHDAHFSDSFPLHRAWYVWLIEYFKRNQFEFISFETAVKEIQISTLKSSRKNADQ